MDKVNWCTYIKNILDNTNNIQIWKDQCISISQITQIKNKLHESFILKTLMDISDTDKFPKLRTYKKLKADFRLEYHLLALENRGHQI